MTRPPLNTLLSPQTLAEYRWAGSSYAQIAAHLPYSRSTIRKYAHRVLTPAERNPPTVRKQIEDADDGSRPAEEVAAEIGCTLTYVRRIRKQRGIASQPLPELAPFIRPRATLAGLQLLPSIAPELGGCSCCAFVPLCRQLVTHHCTLLCERVFTTDLIPPDTLDLTASANGGRPRQTRLRPTPVPR